MTFPAESAADSTKKIGSGKNPLATTLAVDGSDSFRHRHHSGPMWDRGFLLAS